MCLVPVHNVSFARDILGISVRQAFKGSKTEKQKIIRTVKVLHGLLLTPVLHEDKPERWHIVKTGNRRRVFGRVMLCIYRKCIYCRVMLFVRVSQTVRDSKSA